VDVVDRVDRVTEWMRDPFLSALSPRTTPSTPSTPSTASTASTFAVSPRRPFALLDIGTFAA